MEHRTHVAELYRRGLEGLRGVTLPQVPEGQQPVWLYFPIVLDPNEFGLDRDELAQALALENIHARKYFELPCHHMRAYSTGPRPHLPVTERIAYNVLALPVYNDMLDAEATLIVDAIAEAREAANEVRAVLGSRPTQEKTAS